MMTSHLDSNPHKFKLFLRFLIINREQILNIIEFSVFSIRFQV
jgi:hypothetical protein